MLSINNTEKLIGLQGIIVKDIIQKEKWFLNAMLTVTKNLIALEIVFYTYLIIKNK